MAVSCAVAPWWHSMPASAALLPFNCQPAEREKRHSLGRVAFVGVVAAHQARAALLQGVFAGVGHARLARDAREVVALEVWRGQEGGEGGKAGGHDGWARLTSAVN